MCSLSCGGCGLHLFNFLVHAVDVLLEDFLGDVSLKLVSWRQEVVLDREGIGDQSNDLGFLEAGALVLLGQAVHVIQDHLFEFLAGIDVDAGVAGLELFNFGRGWDYDSNAAVLE